MFSSLQHRSALSLKRIVYGRSGEPYRLRGYTLRYLPGTRPVRLRYIHSHNAVTRYDALQVQLFSNSLVEGDTAIDIGAHCGQYAVLMAAMCGQTGRVIAFEPDPYARENLLKNLALNKNIRRPIVEACAVADVEGEATLYSRGGNSLSSLARSGIGFSDKDKPDEIRVPTVSLDSYLLEKNLPEPRWVKIDAEGAEIRILKGAKRVLSSKAGIVCELHPYAWSEFGSTLGELKELAAATDRRLRYLDQRVEIGDAVVYGTVLLECRG